MTGTNDYLKQAEFALAAYSMLTSGVPQVENLESEGKGMAPAQAQKFATTYTVVAQYTDAVTGVSATIFQSGAEYHLAVRGTQLELGDLRADSILAVGVSSRLNPQYIALKTQLDQWIGQGGVLNGKTFTVAGHSLGGYLAAAVKADYSQVSEAYLYNAPGTGGLVGSIADTLSGLFNQPTPGANGIWNIKGSEGISFITGLGGQPSGSIPIQIEAASGIGLDNHSLVRLTDALAIQSLYGYLDSNLTQAQLNELVDASGTPMARTLEASVDALRKLLLGASDTTISEGRDNLYANIYALQNSGVYSALVNNAHIAVLTVSDATALAAKATLAGPDGLAYRYALTEFNSFAFIGADYTTHNANGELDLFDANAGTGQITEQWITDRSAFLSYVTSARIADDDAHGIALFYNQLPGAYYKDSGLGVELYKGDLSYLSANDRPRYLFGGQNNDALIAGSKADHLYGEEGDDYLDGQGGADYLEGGLGFDTYFAGAGDTILDADRSGGVFFDGIMLNKSHLQDDNNYLSVDGKFSYHLENQVLTVTQIATGGVLTIKNYRDSGDLGIELGDPKPAYVPPPSTASNFLQGDLAPKRDKNDQIIYDMWGNIVPDDSDGDGVFDAEPGREDEISDTSGNDLIQAFAGNDQVQRRYGGDDVVFLGDGDDILETVLGVSGRVNADGGAGRDYVGGGLADDLLPTRHITYGMTMMTQGTSFQSGPPSLHAVKLMLSQEIPTPPSATARFLLVAGNGRQN